MPATPKYPRGFLFLELLTIVSSSVDSLWPMFPRRCGPNLRSWMCNTARHFGLVPKSFSFSGQSPIDSLFELWPLEGQRISSTWKYMKTGRTIILCPFSDWLLSTKLNKEWSLDAVSCKISRRGHGSSIFRFCRMTVSQSLSAQAMRRFKLLDYPFEKLFRWVTRIISPSSLLLFPCQGHLVSHESNYSNWSLNYASL